MLLSSAFQSSCLAPVQKHHIVCAVLRTCYHTTRFRFFPLVKLSRFVVILPVFICHDCHHYIFLISDAKFLLKASMPSCVYKNKCIYSTCERASLHSCRAVPNSHAASCSIGLQVARDNSDL